MEYKSPKGFSPLQLTDYFKKNSLKNNVIFLEEFPEFTDLAIKANPRIIRKLKAVNDNHRLLAVSTDPYTIFIIKNPSRMILKAACIDSPFMAANLHDKMDSGLLEELVVHYINIHFKITDPKDRAFYKTDDFFNRIIMYDLKHPKDLKLSSQFLKYLAMNTNNPWIHNILKEHSRWKNDADLVLTAIQS